MVQSLHIFHDKRGRRSPGIYCEQGISSADNKAGRNWLFRTHYWPRILRKQIEAVYIAALITRVRVNLFPSQLAAMLLTHKRIQCTFLVIVPLNERFTVT